MFPDKLGRKLNYTNRERNYIRSHRAELHGALNQARDESARSAILGELEDLDRLTERHRHDPAGSWRFKPFSHLAGFGKTRSFIGRNPQKARFSSEQVKYLGTGCSPVLIEANGVFE